MSQVKDGDTVKVHYTGKLADGSEFDSSADKEPMEFKIGEGKLIPGFEQAVVGMNIGDKNTIKIPSAEAYGERRDDMNVSVEKEKLPEDLTPELGQQLQIQQQDGKAIPVVIADISDTHVTLDANHPLAGEDLTFEIEVVDKS
ncbi:MAG: peptidylprolyl isomerase [Balneolales bacterium]